MSTEHQINIERFICTIGARYNRKSINIDVASCSSMCPGEGYIGLLYGDASRQTMGRAAKFIGAHSVSCHPTDANLPRHNSSRNWYSLWYEKLSWPDQCE